MPVDLTLRRWRRAQKVVNAVSSCRNTWVICATIQCLIGLRDCKRSDSGVHKWGCWRVENDCPGRRLEALILMMFAWTASQYSHAVPATNMFLRFRQVRFEQPVRPSRRAGTSRSQQYRDEGNCMRSAHCPCSQSSEYCLATVIACLVAARAPHRSTCTPAHKQKVCDQLC